MSLLHRSLQPHCLAAIAGLSTGEPSHYSEGFVELQYVRSHKVDILIALDNSSSMAEEQARLAANLEGIIQVLEADDVEADYRIAITTTDAGHPRVRRARPSAARSCSRRARAGSTSSWPTAKVGPGLGD